MDSLQESLILAVLLTACVTSLTYWLSAPLAQRFDLVDCPGGRKHHEGNIPLTGGIGLFLGLIAGLLYLQPDLPGILPLISAVCLLFVVGLLDDLIDLPAGWKLLAQITAACIVMFWGGLQIRGLGNLFHNGLFNLGPFSMPFTLLAIVGYVNALNMADGIDGLAGTLALTTTCALIYLSYTNGLEAEFGTLCLFATCLIVFLVFNARHPLREKAGLFLGDSGTLILGFIVAWFVIHIFTIRPAISDTQSITALWIVAFPILDLLIVMLRRVLRGRSPFSADREHLHHVLLAAGFSVNKTVILIGGMSAAFAIFGLAGSALRIGETNMFLIFVAVAYVATFILFRAWRVVRFLENAGLKMRRLFLPNISSTRYPG